MPMKCPKPDCKLSPGGTVYGAEYGKEIKRHVWKCHVKWAEETNYPPLAQRCDICGNVYARGDLLTRHKREKHENMRRKRGRRS